jgi:hypothetical protein
MALLLTSGDQPEKGSDTKTLGWVSAEWVTEGRAAGTHTHLSAAAIRSGGGPARRAFSHGRGPERTGGAPGRQAAARGLLPCNFSTLRPKSQETDGASAHPPTQTQVKEASTHSLTHSQLLVGQASHSASQPVSSDHHHSPLHRPAQPDSDQANPSVHPSAVAIARHFRCSSRPFLPPFARCRLGLDVHPRRARHYATAGASSSGRVAQCLSSVYKNGHARQQPRPHFPCALTLALPTSAQRLSLSPPLSKVASAMTPKGGRVGDVGSKKPTPRAHPRYVPRRGSVLKGIVRGVLGLVFTLISAPANSGGHRVRPAPPPAPGEGGESDDGAEQGK